MAGQDPDALAREIEQTRVELAETIDLIADRVSPRRAAGRGVAKLRSAVGALGGGGGGRAGSAPPPASPAQIREIASSGHGAANTGTSSYAVRRNLRLDRVVLAAGLAAGVAAAVIWLRRR